MAAAKAYETTTTVEDRGQVHLSGVPFQPGTEVEVTISPRRRPAEEFAAAWQQLCAELRRRPALQSITDEQIHEEVDRYRADRRACCRTARGPAIPYLGPVSLVTSRR